MPTIGEFIFDLAFGKADTKNLDDAEAKSRQASREVAKQWTDAGKSIGKAFAAVTVGALGAAGGIFKLVENTASAGDEVAKTSKGLGIAARELQRLRFAAERSGGSAEGMTRALRTMTVGLQDAVTKGTGPVAEGLDAIGLSAAALQGQGVEDQFGMIAEALGRVDDQATRSAISMKIFGSRGGAALKPLLDSGAEGIRSLGDEAERLGLILGDKTLAQSEQFADDLLDLRGVVKGLVRDVAGGLLPTVSSYLSRAREWVVQNRELIKVKVEEWLLRIVGTLESLVEIAGTVVESGTKLVEMFGGVENAAIAATATFAAFKLAALGLPGVVLGVTAAVGVAVGDMLFGLSESLERIQEIRREMQEIKRQTKLAEEDTGRLEKLDQLLSEDDFQKRGRDFAKLSDEEFQGLLGSVKRSGGDAAQKRRVIDMAREARAHGKEILRQEGFYTGKFAYEDERARRERVQGSRRKRRGGRGGRGGTDDEILIDTQDDVAEELFGPEIRLLAQRGGVGDIAIEAALGAAAESLRSGANEQVARRAALSRLSGLTGQNLANIDDTPMSQVFQDDNLPDVAMSSIARGAQPQTLVSTINNTFMFENEFNIPGSGDPLEVGKAAIGAMRDMFEGALDRSTRTAKVKYAR